MRQAELFALKWRDVDWTNGSVEVRQSLKDTENGLISGESKNKQRRSIKLASTTMRLLHDHRKAQVKKLGSQRLVFPDGMGGFIRRQNFKRRDFARILKRAGELSSLDFKGHSFHDLRHTCATLLLSQGEALPRVSQCLGHASVKTTLDAYAHAIPQDENRSAERFEERFRQSVETDRPPINPQRYVRFRKP